MEGSVRPVDDRERPVPVLLGLLAVVSIWRGWMTPTSTALHLSTSQMSGFWFWSLRWLWVLTSSSALSFPETRRYRHATIMSCLVAARAGASFCAMIEPPFSFRALSSSVSTPHICRQYVAALSGSWCVRVRRRLK